MVYIIVSGKTHTFSLSFFLSSLFVRYLSAKVVAKAIAIAAARAVGALGTAVVVLRSKQTDRQAGRQVGGRAIKHQRKKKRDGRNPQH